MPSASTVPESPGLNTTADSRSSRATMVLTARCKYVRFCGFRPSLFDLIDDPDQVHVAGSVRIDE